VPSAREKVIDKEAFADVLFAEPSLPSVFQAFAECFRHSAKRPIPVVSEVATLPIEGSLAHAMWQSGGAGYKVEEVRSALGEVVYPRQPRLGSPRYVGRDEGGRC
jgi:hypothetical protein